MAVDPIAAGNINPYVEAVGSTLLALGALGAALKKIGYIHLGRRQESGNGQCPDPGCQENVRHLTKEISELRGWQEKNTKKLQGVAEDVAFIRGRLEKGNG